MKIKIKESALRGVVEQHVRRVLAEGLASRSLQKLASEHGGIKSVDRSLQLDKFDADFEQGRWGQKNFIVTKNIYETPDVFLQFMETNPVATFNDGTSVYMVKPEYMQNEKVKNMVAQFQQSSAEMRDQRNNGIEPETWYDSETDDDGRRYSVKQTRKPEQVRQRMHRRSRGVGNPEPQGSSADYDKYVEQFLCQKYNGEVDALQGKSGDYDQKYIKVTLPENVSMYDEQANQIINDFQKYGYGLDEGLSQIETKYSEGGQVLAFRKGVGISQVEIDDKYMYPDYFMPVSHEVNSPKIGTQAFNNLEESVSKNLKKALQEIKVVDQIPDFDRNKSYGKFEGQWMSSQEADNAYWSKVHAKMDADKDRQAIRTNMSNETEQEIRKTHITSLELRQKFPWVVKKDDNEPDGSELTIAYHLIFGWQKKMGRPFTQEAGWYIRRYFTINMYLDEYDPDHNYPYTIEPSEHVMKMLEKTTDQNVSEMSSKDDKFQQSIANQKMMQ